MTNKLYILCGIPFSGKTTLAKAISKRLGYVHIDLDDVKRELYGRVVKDEELKQQDWDCIYREMYKRIESNLRNGQFIVHDTGNLTKHERDLVRQIAQKLGIETLTIFVKIPTSVARDRMMKNRRQKNRFDITDEAFEGAVNEMEPPSKEENVIEFDGTVTTSKWLENNLDK